MQASSSLLTTHYSLLTTHHSLLTTHFSPSARGRRQALLLLCGRTRGCLSARHRVPPRQGRRWAGKQTNKYEPMTAQAFPLHLTSGFPITPDLFPQSHPVSRRWAGGRAARACPPRRAALPTARAPALEGAAGGDNQVAFRASCSAT